MSTGADCVASWNVRGRAYLALARRYPIFEVFANRLVDAALGGDFAGRLLDVGGGFGVATAIALDRHPAARVTLAEPSETMRDLARTELARFGDRVEVVANDASHPAEGAFDAAVSSAVMHLVDEREALPALSQSLAQGALFAFNLWGHSFEDTAEDPEPALIWKPVLDRAMAEQGLKPRPSVPAAKRPRIRTRAGIAEVARSAGLDVMAIEVDSDILPAAFHIDFAAMAPAFLGGLAPETRARLIERARELGGEGISARTARMVLRRTK